MIDGTDAGYNFSFSFDHCWLKTSLQQKFPDAFTACIFNVDPKFKNIEKPDLEPDTLSPLLGAGKPIGVNNDIKGRPRSTENPAIGAYEPNYNVYGLKLKGLKTKK